MSGVTYYNADSVSMQPVSGWQGIRDSGTAGQYLITGTSNANGLLYIGPISGAGGTSYSVNYPDAYSTSVYGPDVVDGNVLRLVGSYRATRAARSRASSSRGRPPTSRFASDYQTIDYPGATYTYVHSTMGDLAVGNADGPEGNAPLGTGHAFIYSVSQAQILTDIVYPGSTSTTAYGIWYNGGTSYTIAGGYSMLGSPGKTLGAGLSGRLRLVDRAIHQLDVVRRSGRTGRPVLRHPLRGHQQPRAGRLHPRGHRDGSRVEHGPPRLRSRPSNAIPTARSAPPPGST